MQIDRPIAIALILFIVLLLVFFLVMPEYQAFGKLQSELGEKKAEFNAEFDYYAAITKTYYDLQSRADDIKKIDDALPQDSELGKLIYFLQKTAGENGMMIKDLFLSKSSLGAQISTTSNVKDIVFSTDLLGNYSSLEKFMIALEKSSRLFEVTNISFGSGSQSPLKSSQTQFQIQQTYSFNLQIKTHSY
ncbi:MAG: type 4a pilus biogenesis protein PilO [Candidatus Staskawiczbacteria bacterium]|jgi:Tfp pilus assembly protein PilO